MASAEFTEESKQKRPNVQVGDPFLEKLLLEACLEAMKTGAIVGIQDMGAAGLTCSICEMGSRGGDRHRDRPGPRPAARNRHDAPTRCMLSESQERMLLVAEKGREDEVFRVFSKWGLDAVTIGVVTADGMLRVRHHGKVVAEIPNRALADEAPLYDRPHNRSRCAPRRWRRPTFAQRSDLNADLLQAGRLGGSLFASAGSGSSTTTWCAPTPSPDRAATPPSCASRKPTRPSPCRSTATAATATSIRAKARKLIVAECCRNLATAGATPVAATNNLNFGNPERPEIMAQLVEAIEGHGGGLHVLRDADHRRQRQPLQRDARRRHYPTPVMGIIGLMTTAKPVPKHFQEEGRTSFFGRAGRDGRDAFGGTAIREGCSGHAVGPPAELDMAYEKRVHEPCEHRGGGIGGESRTTSAPAAWDSRLP